MTDPTKNGVAPPIERHAPWCERFGGGSRCTCRPIPALRCDACGSLYEPTEGETPVRFAERVELHAKVHPQGATSFTQGRVTRTLRGEGQPPDDPNRI